MTMKEYLESVLTESNTFDNNNENTFVLETGLDNNKCCVKFDKGAIYQTAPAEGAAYAKPEEEKQEEVVEQPTEEAVTETVAEEIPAKPKRKKREEI